MIIDKLPEINANELISKIEDTIQAVSKPENRDISALVLSLLQIADQAKIIHFQTDCRNEHNRFGDFYDEFIELSDNLIESIMGKYGRSILNFNQGAVMLYGYELAKLSFFESFDNILINHFSELFDKDKDSELFSIIDDMLNLKNKMQYLLQLK